MIMISIPLTLDLDINGSDLIYHPLTLLYACYTLEIYQFYLLFSFWAPHMVYNTLYTIAKHSNFIFIVGLHAIIKPASYNKTKQNTKIYEIKEKQHGAKAKYIYVYYT